MRGRLPHVSVVCHSSTSVLPIVFRPCKWLRRLRFSLCGTLTNEHCHLHIAVADAQGQVWGGHLLDGNLINTTAELMIHHYPQHHFTRQYDPNTGYSELIVKP